MPMTSTSPLPRHILLAVAIAALTTILGCGIQMSSSDDRTKKPRTPEPIPSKAAVAAEDIIYNIVKEPANTLPIILGCDFDIKNYVDNPYGYRHEGLSGGWMWVKNQMKGGLERTPGNKLMHIMESKRWRTNTPDIQARPQRKTFYHIGKDTTHKQKYYLGVLEGVEYTFIEIPDVIAKRIGISNDDISAFTFDCALTSPSKS